MRNAFAALGATLLLVFAVATAAGTMILGAAILVVLGAGVVGALGERGRTIAHDRGVTASGWGASARLGLDTAVAGFAAAVDAAIRREAARREAVGDDGPTFRSRLGDAWQRYRLPRSSPDRSPAGDVIPAPAGADPEVSVPADPEPGGQFVLGRAEERVKALREATTPGRCAACGAPAWKPGNAGTLASLFCLPCIDRCFKHISEGEDTDCVVCGSKNPEPATPPPSGPDSPDEPPPNPDATASATASATVPAEPQQQEETTVRTPHTADLGTGGRAAISGLVVDWETSVAAREHPETFIAWLQAAAAAARQASTLVPELVQQFHGRGPNGHAGVPDQQIDEFAQAFMDAREAEANAYSKWAADYAAYVEAATDTLTQSYGKEVIASSYEAHRGNAAA